MSEWKETDIGKLPKSWDTVSIGNLIEEMGIAVGVMYPGENVPSGTPLIRAGDVRNNRIDTNIHYRISDDVNRIYKRTILRGGEILVVLVGNPGLSSIVPNDLAGWNVARAIGVMKLKDKSNGKFIIYALRHPYVYYNITASCNTTVQATLNLKELKEILIPWPEQVLRQSIAEVLSSLDDKIDLLHRQNKTLEQLAETLFRQWFVEEAEENWEEGKLEDLINVKYGKDHKKVMDGNIPVYGSGGIMRYGDRSLYDKESILIPRKGTLNNIVYIDDPFWTVDTMFYTEMKKSNAAKFVFHFLKRQDLASMNVGSAVPSMTTEVLNNMPVLIPSDSVLAEFESVVSELYKKMKTNTIQTITLTRLRDTLLPKLMSGEVRMNN